MDTFLAFVECPYCGAGQEICHDEVHEQECDECAKTFVFGADPQGPPFTKVYWPDYQMRCPKCSGTGKLPQIYTLGPERLCWQCDGHGVVLR